MTTTLIQPSRGVRKSLNPYRSSIIRPKLQDKLYTTKPGVCRRHGQTIFRSSIDRRFQDDNGSPLVVYRCSACYQIKKERSRKKNIKQLALNKKKKLVEVAGGSCKLCKYNRCLSALHFHHLNKALKNFEISYGLRRLGMSKLLEETAKCVLLCNRCHIEVEEGLVLL